MEPQIDINHLTEEELIELNQRIVDRLKQIQQAHDLHNMMRFNRGARVSFETRQGRVFATIIKFNRKTVTVESDQGQRWKVSPHLLSEVDDVTPEERKLYYNNFKDL